MRDDTQPIRDPKMLRALAHPLRWKLINLLTEEGSATATRCAAVTGESVASCSYHLNMLAKYGFVEEAAGGQGREKPWRVTNHRQELSSHGLDQEGVLAVEAVGEALLDNEFAEMRARYRGRHTEPAPWRELNRITTATAFATAEELAQLNDELGAILSRFDDRLDDPAKRPDGARAVRLFLSATLTPERDPD